MFEEEPRFWAAIVGAVLIKVLMSKNLKPVNAALTIVAGIYSGWAFTGFFVDLFAKHFEMQPTTQNIVIIAGVVSMTGENLIRQVINFSNSENMLLEIWKIWRGKP